MRNFLYQRAVENLAEQINESGNPPSPQRREGSEKTKYDVFVNSLQGIVDCPSVNLCLRKKLKLVFLKVESPFNHSSALVAGKLLISFTKSSCNQE